MRGGKRAGRTRRVQQVRLMRGRPTGPRSTAGEGGTREDARMHDRSDPDPNRLRRNADDRRKRKGATQGTGIAALRRELRRRRTGRKRRRHGRRTFQRRDRRSALYRKRHSLGNRRTPCTSRGGDRPRRIAARCGKARAAERHCIGQPHGHRGGLAQPSRGSLGGLRLGSPVPPHEPERLGEAGGSGKGSALPGKTAPRGHCGPCGQSLLRGAGGGNGQMGRGGAPAKHFRPGRSRGPCFRTGHTDLLSPGASDRRGVRDGDGRRHDLPCPQDGATRALQL
jgi:hypothetical protein